MRWPPLGCTWALLAAATASTAVPTVSAAVSPSPQAARTVLDVPVIAQAYNLSCEAASLQMALAYEHIDVPQATLLKLMKPDYTTPELSGGKVVRWSDPYANFVGDPSGHEYNYTGYGAYFPVVTRVAQAAGATVTWSGVGLTWERLQQYVSTGHPVVAWVAYDGQRYAATGPLYHYDAWDGRRVPFGPGYEHAVTVAGISDAAVLLDNPRWGFRQWLPKAAFLSTFAVFGAMAVVI